MSDSTIGIKIADGSYYPVLEKGFSGRKKLTVTTIKDNQEKVQIDLYRGNGGVDEPRYIGSLIVENIPPAPQGEPEIELLIGINREGELSAEANDRRTGESQKFSTTLTTLSEEEISEAPEFEIEEEKPAAKTDFEEPPLTGESYRVSDKDRRKEPLQSRGPNLLLLILFVILGVILVAAIAYFIYRSVRGPEIPPLSARGTAPSAAVAPQQPAPATPQPAEGQPQAGSSGAQAGGTQPQAGSGQPLAGTGQQGSGGQTSVKGSGGEAALVAKGGVTYRIKKGDTLWDISASYYRNPWLYPKLARANSIRNPDLIFAGTRIYIPEN